MKQVTFRRFLLALTSAMLLLAWPVVQAQGLIPTGGLSGDSSGNQQAPWQNQAQQLQQRLSPATDDMKLGATSSLLTGSGSGLSGGARLGSALQGAQEAVGTQPWTQQAQQLQSRLAGGTSAPSIGGLSLAGAAGGNAPSSIPAPSAGGGITNPYAGGVSVPSVGSAVPGANSPYTSTGNAAGVTPYRRPYGLPRVGLN